jgi:rare lipoprotein A (peptidoglycan hydrolase)
MGKKVACLTLVFWAIICLGWQIKGVNGYECIYLREYGGSVEQSQVGTMKLRKEKPDLNHTVVSQTAIGKASWYGPGFHGRLTASGEIFDEEALTAAHRQLAFGTKVKVTNLHNGKSIMVTINDRGPYIEGRHIDLSKAAARELEMIKMGVAHVKMEVMNDL